MARIILMDDDLEQAKALGELLSFSGHDVTVTNSNDEAYAKLNGSSEYDLLITDIFTPISENTQIEGGMTLINQVRNSAIEVTRSIPIISISGIRLPRSLAYSFDDPNGFGSDAHLAKPFGLDRLTETIDELLHSPRQFN